MQEGASHLQMGWLAAALHPLAVDVDPGALLYDPRCRTQRRHDVDHGLLAGGQTCRHSRVAEVSLLEACPEQRSKTGRPKPPMTTLLSQEEALDTLREPGSKCGHPNNAVLKVGNLDGRLPPDGFVRSTG